MLRILLLILCLSLGACAADEFRVQPKGQVVVGGGVGNAPR